MNISKSATSLNPMSNNRQLHDPPGGLFRHFQERLGVYLDPSPRPTGAAITVQALVYLEVDVVEHLARMGGLTLGVVRGYALGYTYGHTLQDNLPNSTLRLHIKQLEPVAYPAIPPFKVEAVEALGVSVGLAYAGNFKVAGGYDEVKWLGQEVKALVLAATAGGPKMSFPPGVPDSDSLVGLDRPT